MLLLSCASPLHSRSSQPLIRLVSRTMGSKTRIQAPREGISLITASRATTRVEITAKAVTTNRGRPPLSPTRCNGRTVEKGRWRLVSALFLLLYFLLLKFSLECICLHIYLYLFYISSFFQLLAFFLMFFYPLFFYHSKKRIVSVIKGVWHLNPTHTPTLFLVCLFVYLWT